MCFGKKVIISCLFVITILTKTLVAQTSENIYHSLSILNIASARSDGMMNITFSSANDASTIFLNPALMMTLLKDNSINFTYKLNNDFSPDTQLSYTHLWNNFGLGLGIATEQKVIEKYNALGEDSGKYTHGLYLFNVSAAFALDKAFVGISIKNLINAVENNVDYGLLADISVSKQVLMPAFKVSAGVRNFGFYQNVFCFIDPEAVFSMAYSQEDNAITVGIDYGLSLPSLNHRIGLGLEAMVIRFNKLNRVAIYNLDDFPESILDDDSAATKRKLSNLPNGLLVRAGLSTEGASLGLGLYINIFRLDYALTFNRFLLDTMSHTFALSFIF